MSRHPGLRAVLAGVAFGLAWGVVARVFMRLVSDAPSFSWAGTLGILAVAAWFGAFVAAASAKLRAGRRGWWRLLALPALLLFAGQGAPFLPGALLGAIALSRRWRPALSVPVAVVANAAVPVVMWWQLRLDEVTMLSAPYRAQAAALILMPLLGLALAWWSRGLFVPARGRRLAQSASPERARSSRRSESSLAAPAGPA
ncbi:hypothetical protein GCM10027517_23640 [Phycicoccus ginsengisoli]